MKLTPRLQKIVDIVPSSNCIGDIGSDHAYIPIELIKRNKCNYAIASDIGIGPLKNAIDSIKKANMYHNNLIQTRLGSGLEPYNINEIDTAIFAGMGGELICDILKASPDKVSSIKTFVFQPMVAQYELRKWLVDNDFCITSESLARETHHIYEIFTATHIKSKNNYKENSTDELLYEIGMLPFKKNDQLTIDFIKSKILSTQAIIVGMNKSKNKNFSTEISNLNIKLIKLNQILDEIMN